MTLDDNALKRVRDAVARFPDRELAKLAVLVGDDRVKVASRFSVAIDLRHAGRRQVARVVDEAKVPAGHVLVLSAPRGEAEAVVVELYPSRAR